MVSGPVLDRAIPRTETLTVGRPRGEDTLRRIQQMNTEADDRREAMGGTAHHLLVVVVSLLITVWS